MSENTKICPTCGTRIPATATRCPVCGTTFTDGEKAPQLKPGRFPEVTLSLPLALAMLAFFVALGAGLVYFALNQMNRIAEPTPIPSATPSPSPTLTPTPVTPTPTFTPLPSPTPFTYVVQQGDTCSSIALAFDISVRSLVLLNNLPASCDTLFVGQKLLIPQPTPTPTPQPTGTLSPEEATRQACERVVYEVKENDTLSSIALNYNVPMDAIRRYNGLVGDQVFFGQKLVIPLCERNPTPGPTPTPTPPPPYPAPNLLLPIDGAVFTLADEAVVLQWASVGELRENEAYAVTVEDVTADRGRKLVAYVTDTKYIVPNDFRPNESAPHVFRWWVVTVRQSGTDDNGNPIWTPAGAPSETRVFAWAGVAPVATPTP